VNRAVPPRDSLIAYGAIGREGRPHAAAPPSAFHDLNSSAVQSAWNNFLVSSENVVPWCVWQDRGVAISSRRCAILALHWQVNVIKPEGFFGPMLSAPVARCGVVERAVRFHEAARAAGVPVVFTLFTVPVGEGDLVRNTAFMRAVGDAQEAFRPDAVGTQLIEEMSALVQRDRVVANQKLSGLAANDLPHWLAERGIDTLFVTGVATNLVVEQTARHGTDLGLTVHTVSDCVAAASDAVHAASLANLELTTAGCLTAEEVLALLR
jgi:nicotinamidase-related amidase